MSNKHERDLVKEFVEAKAEKERTEKVKKAAQKRLDAAIHAIYVHLQDEDCNATASHKDLGRAQMNIPRIFASIKNDIKGNVRAKEFKKWLDDKDKKDGKKDNEPRTKDWLFKDTVASGTLSTYITELIDNDEPVPRCIDFYAKTQLKNY